VSSFCQLLVCHFMVQVLPIGQNRVEECLHVCLCLFLVSGQDVWTTPADRKVWSERVPQPLDFAGAQLRSPHMLREKLGMDKSVVVLQCLKPLSLGEVCLPSAQRVSVSYQVCKLSLKLLFRKEGSTPFP